MKNAYVKLSAYEHRTIYNDFDKWIKKNRHKLSVDDYYEQIELHTQLLANTTEQLKGEQYGEIKSN